MPELFPDQVPEGWNRSSEDYDRGLWRLMRPFVRDAIEQARIGPDAHVLDVAAGSGAFTLEAARRARTVLAVDFAGEMLARLGRRAARAGRANVRTAVMDGQALTLESASFDVALSNFGVIFFPDRIRGFSEMHRVLRPGGRAVVTAWRRLEMFDAFRQAVVAALGEPPPHAPPPPVLSLADRTRFEEEMRAGGFADVAIHTVMHAFAVESAGAFWDLMRRSAPPAIALLEQVGPAPARRVRDALLRRLAARFGSGEVVFWNEAHIGVGLRASDTALPLAGQCRVRPRAAGRPPRTRA